MKFFVSWTSRDPIFQQYDSECNVLLSPANVPRNWSVSDWPLLPKELFVDSGGFSYNQNNIPSCRDVLERQRFISRNWPGDRKLFLSHPDLAIPMQARFAEVNKIISLSLERAKEYINLFYRQNILATPIGVIQGFDEETILLSFQELKDAGYTFFALGSLALRQARYKKICLDAIEVVTRYSISPVHVFGVTWPLLTSDIPRGIESFDTSSPAKLAFYGTVLYGPPLKRYVISPNAFQEYHDRCFTFRKGIPNSLACVCPVCQTDPNNLSSYHGRAAKQKRTVHNYFQIKWDIQSKCYRGNGH